MKGINVINKYKSYKDLPTYRPGVLVQRTSPLPGDIVLGTNKVTVYNEDGSTTVR